MCLCIGTSGYSYPFWKGRFYPSSIKPKDWLTYYAQQFSCVELNNTFYRFPVYKNLDRYYERTPDNFLFSVKVHKVITHMLKLMGAKEKIETFTAVVEDALKDKLGAVLFQFPPGFHYSAEHLERIVNNIRPNKKYVLEFRHNSWWKAEVWNDLERLGMSFCHVSFPGLPMYPFVQAPLFYLRMHGVPELFKSSYTHPTLKKLAQEVDKKNGFIFFNNTTFEAGFQNARALKTIRNE